MAANSKGSKQLWKQKLMPANSNCSNQQCQQTIMVEKTMAAAARVRMPQHASLYCLNAIMIH